jgi:hypothetical protein
MAITAGLLGSTTITITVMSIIILVITFLLGEYNKEERNGRRRYQDIYKTGLIVLNAGLALAVISLLTGVIYLVLDSVSLNGMIIQFSVISSATFISAILVASIGTFFITAKVLMRD